MIKTFAKFLAIAIIVTPALIPINISSAATQSTDLESSSSMYFSHSDNADLSGGSTFSLEIWFKAESDGSPKVISKRGGATDKGYNLIYQSSANNLVLQCSSTGASFDGDTSVSFTINTETWYFFGVSFDSGSVKYYAAADGNTVTQVGTTQSSSASSCHDDDGDFNIGREAGDGGYHDGELFLARKWDDVRTESEFNTNKCAELGSTANLNGEWIFDGNANDNSGNGYNLTENNTPTYVSDIPSDCSAAPAPINRPPIIWFD